MRKCFLVIEEPFLEKQEPFPLKEGRVLEFLETFPGKEEAIAEIEETFPPEKSRFLEFRSTFPGKEEIIAEIPMVPGDLF